MNEKLRLPASCTQLDAAERAALTGGCFIRPSTTCFMLAMFFRPNTGYELWGYRKPLLLQQEHGDIVGLRYDVYTYADGYVYTYKQPRKNTGLWRVVNFFDDMGDFWRSIGL